MSDFFQFWFYCFVDGITAGKGAVAFAELICVFLWFRLGRNDDNEIYKKRQKKIKAWGKWGFLVLLIFSTIFVAPYNRYKREADEKVEAKKKLVDRSAKLNGFVNRFLIADEPGTTNSLVFLEVTIGNSGGSPSIAEEYALKAALSKTTSTNADPINFSGDYKINFWDEGKLYLLDLKRAQLISEKTMKAIQPGESPRGWLAFRFCGMPMSRYQSTNIVLSFLDINENRIFVTNEFRKASIGKIKSNVDAIAMTLPGSDNIFSLVEPKTETNGKWMPPELPPGCSNVVVFLGTSGMVYSRFIAESAAGTKFAIKDLPEFFSKDLDKAPNYSPRQKFMWLKSEMMYSVNGKNVKHPIQPVIVSNRLYVEVQIPFLNEKRKIVMNDDLDPELPIPPRWDRNYSTNYSERTGIYAYEVVNELTNPVLQVTYSAPNEVHINGIFQVGSNNVLAAFDQQPQMLTFTINEQNQTQDVMTASLDLENFHETLIIHSNETIASFGQRLTNEFFRPIFKNQKPIFKYPSNRNTGVFADWVKELIDGETNSINKPNGSK